MRNNKKFDIKTFLDDNKLTYKEDEKEFKVNCFICNETRNRLGISKENGKWHCFNCGAKGTKAYSLQYGLTNKDNIKTNIHIQKEEKEEKCTIDPEIHLKYAKLIHKTDKYKSKEYVIKERGLTEECVDFFKLGARRKFTTESGESYDHGEYLVIPYIKSDKCVNLKYRALDPEVKKGHKWKREKGGVSILFNDQVLDDLDYDEIYIAEAEIDAMSLWSNGIKNVVSLTTGAKTFKSSWYERLRRFKKIYIVLDNDEAGREGAELLSKRLGMGRCYNVTLSDDVKDLNEYLLKHTIEEFNKLVDKATQFEIRGVVSLKESFNQRLNKKDNPDDNSIGYTTRWQKLNKVMGKFKPGNLVILSGRPKSGKTSFIIDLATDLADQGIAGGMYSCEMQHMALTEKVTSKVLKVGFNSSQFSFDDLEEIDLIYAKFMMRNMSKNFHMYYPEMGDLELDKVITRITEMVQRYGLKFFIFDNLHFLCRGEDEKTMIDKATRAFKLLAENLGIVFFLLSHPRKTNHNRQLSNDDLKGSSSIFQDADLIILMHRRNVDGDMLPEEMEEGVSEGAMSSRAEFLITGRFVEGGKTYLAFHGDICTFKDHGTLFNSCMKDILDSSKKKKKKGF